MKRIFIVNTQLKKAAGIYQISCSESEKVYIGESVNISARMQKHFSLLRKNKHSNPILQAMFNKHGESTFVVDVLEYVDTKDELFLKKLEQEYQQKNPNCISLDCNEIFHIERSEKWKQKQGEFLNTIRELSLENWRVPILVYDIQEKKLIEFKQLIDTSDLIEQKHLYKNIKENVLIPYKNRYVAFLKSEFTEDKLNNIIVTNNGKSYSTVRNITTLYDLNTFTHKIFSSKSSFSLEFSDSKNSSLYDNMIENKIITWDLKTPIEVNCKNDFLDLNIFLKNTSRTKRCNIKLWLKALKATTVKVEIQNISGINRKLLTEIFEERSQFDWIQLLESVLQKLPD